MRAARIAACLIALAAAQIARPGEAAPPAKSPTGSPGREVKPRRYTTWDLNLDGAMGYAFEDDAHLSGFGRIRGGLLFVDERNFTAPSFTSLGLVYEISDLSPATVGFQAETMSLSSGTWAQIGAMVDLVQVRPVFMASVGFSVLGAEVQLRGDDEQSAYWALYAKLRVPVSIIAIALSD
jgi:hypothetical protein